MNIIRFATLVVLLVLSSTVTTSAQTFAKQTELLADKEPAEDINDFINEFYSSYSSVLKNYVDKNGLVNYPKLRRHRLELLPQILEFANVSETDFEKWPDNEKLAFWINAYNFFAINIVIQNYPIKSPFYAKIWWPGNSIVHIEGFYNNKFFKIMDLEYNLNEVEQKIIDFNNPGACFAICRATLGSPGLIRRPYRGFMLEKQLNDKIKVYLSRNVGVDYIAGDKQLYLSEIFDKNANIFIKNYTKQKRFRSFEPKIQAAFNFIYAKAAKKTVEVILKATPETKIEFERKNWRYFMHLNQSGTDLH